MLRVAIVEDNLQEREQLAAMLHAYEEREQFPMELCLFSDGSEILQRYPQDVAVIFMDIDMKEVDGITAARRIRTFDSEVILVFLTHMVQYALAGYEVEALDFLIKPLDDYKLAQEMARIRKKRQERKPFYLTVRDHYATHRLDADEILYIETAQRKLIYHTATGQIQGSGVLHEWEKMLRPRHFFRIHTAYLVNLRYVRSVRENEIVVGEEVLPLSRHRKKEFREVFTAFMGSEL